VRKKLEIVGGKLIASLGFICVPL